MVWLMDLGWEEVQQTNASASYTNLTGTLVPFVQRQTGISSCSINFGQKPFKYTPPEGFKPINFCQSPALQKQH